ncbi:MAG: 16S rRNA (cytidine(1402)-2'-O)-methyltransferase [Chloroflexota bacterium]
MPCLYVVPTPIGNLEDITLRALRVLGQVSIVLSEDTRHTAKLLRHYGIRTRLLSYHQHNKRTRLDEIIRLLTDGDIALVSNAGMPSISDPGFELIQLAVNQGMEVDILPGPSAVTTAVVAACLPAPGFLFLGFLPRRSGERTKNLHFLEKLPYSLVVYEAPHRLVALLRDASAVLGPRTAVVGRELTKLHQEVIRGDLPELLEYFQRIAPRGECTVVISGATELAENYIQAFEGLSVRYRRGESRRAAVAAVTREFGVSRNTLYRAWLQALSDDAEEVTDPGSAAVRDKLRVKVP